MKKSHWLLTLLILSLLTAISTAQTPDENMTRGLDSIQPEEAYNLVKTMALPEYAGRHTGHEGYTKAARWAAQFYKKWGLKPLSKQAGYLQEYPSPYVVVDRAEMNLLLGKEENRVKLAPETDFLPLLASDSGDNTAGMVFAGWGIHAPELGYDDYSGLDVKGKFILCFRGTPDRGDDRYQKHDHHRHINRPDQFSVFAPLGVTLHQADNHRYQSDVPGDDSNNSQLFTEQIGAQQFR